MRWIIALLSTVSLALGAAPSGVDFVRIWPQWRNADAFDRITEYFGGHENDGRETVLRSRPEARAGMYFLVRVKTAASISNGKFVLQIIRPDAPDAKSFVFPASVPEKGRVFELGLTGSDWPGGRDAHAVAWKLTLFDSAGQVVADQQSFLWAMPAP